MERQTESGPLLLTHGLVIDGTGADARPDSAVLVDEGRIRAVGPEASIDLPPGTRVIDVGGRTIMPGIIDCHDHLAHTGFDVVGRAASPLSLTTLRIAEYLRITLEAGITTIRDAGGLDAGFKTAVEHGLIPGPRLVISLVIISRTGGIGDPRLPTGVNLSRESPDLPWPVADGPDECRRKVREVLAAGADVVKCASTGGVSSRTLTATDPTYGYEELKVIADEGHALGRRSMVHAYGGPGLSDAVRAGIDTIEHGAYLCRMPEVLDRMADQATFLIPTFMVLALHREKGSLWAKRKATELYEDHVRSLQMAMEHGIPIAMGTDAGAYGHGHNAVELELMVEAGMTPMQSIVASTQTAAECCDLAADVGTLEPDKFADLLVVDGNPLTNIKVLTQQDRLALVMKGGRAYVDRLTRANEAVARA